MKYQTIEDIVKDYISFTGSPSSKGWNSVYCEVCGDGTHSKGMRGGWLFESDIAFYNCFNCGVDGSFDPYREAPFSKHMYNIFKSFDVPLKYCYQLIQNDEFKEKRKVAPKPVEFTEVYFPNYFYPLAQADEDNVIAEKARNHLITERLIDPHSYPFYLCGPSDGDNPKDKNIARAFIDRLIMPYYMNDTIIGYEGMALGDQSKKYISMGSGLISGYNNIFSQNTTKPLFVTEGFFDAFHLRGAAVLTNKLSKRAVTILERTSRPKIVVPDRNNEYNALADQALELGWGLSLPDIKPYKDVSEAIKHYGILYVVKSCMDNIRYGNPAKINLKIYNMV